MFQPRIRDAKLLLALSTLAAPWTVFVRGAGLGWGLAWAWGWFVSTPVLQDGTQYRTLLQLLALADRFDPVLPLYLWAIAGAVAIAATVYVALARGTRGSTTRQEDRYLGGAFVGAGALYLLSRFLIYDWLLVGQPSDAYYYTVPLGALWVVFVGVVFYRDLFRMGA